MYILRTTSRYWLNPRILDNKYKDYLPCSYPGQLTLDHSPGYSSSNIARDLIYEFNPKIRLILIVRDPIERCISYYTFFKKNYYNRSFEDVMCGEERPKGIIWKQSSYYDLITKWLQKFSREQVLVIEANEIRYKPYDVMVRVENFLGIDNVVRRSDFRFNEEKQFYCYMIDGKLTCLGSTKGLEHPTVDPACIEKLKFYFESSNRKFFELIGKDYGW